MEIRSDLRDKERSSAGAVLSERAALAASVKELARFDGPPEEFWPRYLEGVARVAEAAAALLSVRTADDGEWRSLSLWPVDQRRAIRDCGLGGLVGELAAGAADAGLCWRSAPDPAAGVLLALAVAIDAAADTPPSAVILFFPSELSAAARQGVETAIAFAAAVPAAYQAARMARQVRQDTAQYAGALDLMTLVNDQKKFMAAAMTFCNELAERYQCDRVSLGWLEDNYIRAQAVSHIEKFQKKMDAVQALEAAMEECYDQDEEILFPAPAGATYVCREHEAYAKEEGAGRVLSLPIRVDGDPAGVLLCERAGDAFSEDEVRALRVHCDLAARRLSDLKEYDRWAGARFASWLRERLSGLLGPRHTLTKAVGVIVALALLFIVFGRLPYRVEAPFILKADDLAFLPAPFEGYIDQVNVEPGDLVKEGDVLLSLDIKELLLEESTALANLNRYGREAEKARAQNALADMNIALALKKQAEARLEQVRYRLEHAELRAPFAGVVAEGDLKELLGAPVRKGDVLFKVAKLEKMYAELSVDERDIHEIEAAATGEIAFISRPQLTYPMRVSRIEPVAVAKEEGNVFLLRCDPTGEPDDWWRPGMSGVSKVDVGWRNVFWILTHRTIDFFRILLWW